MGGLRKCVQFAHKKKAKMFYVNTAIEVPLFLERKKREEKGNLLFFLFVGVVLSQKV